MKKSHIIIIIVLVAYLLLVYLFVGKKNIEEQQSNEILLIDYNTKFKYNNYKWSKIENNDYLEYNGKFYNVYKNKELFGNYELSFNNKWYLFDKNRKSVTYNHEMFAHHGNKKIKFINYEKKVIDSKDTKNISKAMAQIGIENYEGILEGEKITINYDDDFRNEIFYDINNETNENVLSMIFMVDNGKVTIIDYDYLTKDRELILKNYIFHSIIDIGVDKKYEVIISQSTFGEHIPFCHYMLYNTGEVEFVTSCESR